MTSECGENEIERLVVEDKRLIFTIVSYVAALVIFLNLRVLATVLSQQLATILVPLIGGVSSIVYFLINGIFLGHLMFKKELFFLKLILGDLLLLALLGVTAWIVVIVSNLDVTRSVAVLLIVSTTTSILNRVGPSLWNRRKNHM